MPHPILTALRVQLRRHACSANAAPMEAYLKSRIPFYGVRTPLMRRICGEVFTAYPLGSAAEWRDAVRAVWEEATHGEERHAAIKLAGWRAHRDFESLSARSLYRAMIVSGAWWDTVDALAHRVGSLLRKYPASMRKTLRAWARGKDLWLRRVAIIAQVGFKRETDVELLYDCIAPSLGEREFFLRKAIGWALREYAKVNPGEVRRYLTAQGERLSPLSRREALKGIGFARRRGTAQRKRG